MLRNPVDMVKKAIAPPSIFLALILAAGCYFTQYPEVMETHLTLFEEYGSKLQVLADAGIRVPPQDWGEYVYPQERAVDFARIVGERFGGQASLAAFNIVLKRYGELVATPDILNQPGAAVRIAARRESLQAAIERTRAALAAEE